MFFKNANNIVKDSEIKEIALEGLIEFDKLCKNEHLVYFLAFGTLLGAMRHKGFIPWDDDIDVLMPRKDYERLYMLADRFQETKWTLFSYRNNNKFLMPYMKLCNNETAVVPSRFSSGLIYGLSIDIFPLDYTDGESDLAVKGKVVDMKNRIVNLERKAYKTGVYEQGLSQSVKRFAKKAFYHLLSDRHKRLLKEYKRNDNLLASQSEKNGEYAFYLYNRYDTVWEKKDFIGAGGEYISVDFEGLSFSAPVNPDAVLSKIYGDYMELPPLDQRKTVHTFKAYYQNSRLAK